MLFNQIVLLTCSSESVSSSIIRKQITLDLKELAGNGQIFTERSRNILYERIKQKPPGN